MSYSSKKDGSGDYLLVISGLTRQAPYLAGWQEFKDHIRKVVKEQPGWVDVLPSQKGRRGEMQGWARLRDRDDADAAFKTYYRSKGMLVHVWETYRSVEGFRLLRCNCSAQFPEVPEGSHSATRCGIDLDRVSDLTAAARTSFSAPDTFYVHSHPSYAYAYPPPQTYAPPMAYPSYVPPTHVPLYTTSRSGMPVNVRNGAILTEARGIFIQNLSYRCTTSDLQSLLQTVGRPIDHRLIRDQRTNAFKGVATAQFASKEEAQHAATYLNRKEHMGMTLNVRMDKETVAVGQAGPPLIVGSDMYRCQTLAG